VASLIFLTSFAISSCSISYSPIYWISERSLQKTQGNRQLIRQLGIYLGEFYFAICLQRLLNELKEESATIIGAFPYFNAVAAPMLLPQSRTFEFVCCKKLTTVSTCYDYLIPKLTVSA
jgi:hypothetical protein